MFDETIMTANADRSHVYATVNWTDYPVMNMHPHAWLLYSIAKLIGVEFTLQGLTLTPALPLETYRFSSSLLALEKTRDGYAGWYQPLAPGVWSIEFRPPEGERREFGRLQVNDSELPIRPTGRGAICLSGAGAPGAPLRWKLDYRKLTRSRPTV